MIFSAIDILSDRLPVEGLSSAMLNFLDSFLDELRLNQDDSTYTESFRLGKSLTFSMTLYVSALLVGSGFLHLVEFLESAYIKLYQVVAWPCQDRCTYPTSWTRKSLKGPSFWLCPDYYFFF